MRVLIVEDDAELARILRDGFADQGIDAIVAATAPEGRERARFGHYDVIVLDVMLPGGSGIELCRALRARGVGTPVLMLTARDALDDRVRGLDAGADDYVVKPFAFRELLARVRALARRPASLVPAVRRIGDLEVDLGARRVRRAGREVPLTAKEFALLEVLARHAGRTLSRAEISAYVWDENHDPFTNVLDVLVRRLRRKIDDDHDEKLIHTMRGTGYRLGG